MRKKNVLLSLQKSTASFISWSFTQLKLPHSLFHLYQSLVSCVFLIFFLFWYLFLNLNLELFPPVSLAKFVGLFTLIILVHYRTSRKAIVSYAVFSDIMISNILISSDIGDKWRCGPGHGRTQEGGQGRAAVKPPLAQNLGTPMGKGVSCLFYLSYSKFLSSHKKIGGLFATMNLILFLQVKVNLPASVECLTSVCNKLDSAVSSDRLSLSFPYRRWENLNPFW